MKISLVVMTVLLFDGVARADLGLFEAPYLRAELNEIASEPTGNHQWLTLFTRRGSFSSFVFRESRGVDCATDCNDVVYSRRFVISKLQYTHCGSRIFIADDGAGTSLRVEDRTGPPLCDEYTEPAQWKVRMITWYGHERLFVGDPVN